MSEDIIKITKVDDIFELLSALYLDMNSLNLYRGQRYYPDKQMENMHAHDLSLKPSAWRSNEQTKQMHNILEEFIANSSESVANKIRDSGYRESHVKQSLAEMVVLERFCHYANKMALYLPYAQPFGFSEYDAGNVYHWCNYICNNTWGYLAPRDKITRKQAGYQYVTLAPEIFITLSLAQHHGVPTRLLYWSLAPLKAIYFALNSELYSGNDNSKPALIKLKYNICRELKIHGWLNENPSLINMVPAWTNNFLHNQEGVFTYVHAPYPEDFNFTTPSLEEIIVMHKDEYNGEPILEIFILDGDIDKMKSQVKFLGVSKQHLFPSYATCTEELFPRK